ncbi:MAG: DUF1588 domain-containing protein [Cystobacterineae bacterium]|nr:DUF1588 domain-containing protein [Cystobacterineae bacterium]
MALSLLYVLTGCHGGVNNASSDSEEILLDAFCQTQRQQFHQEVWGPLFVKTCQGCHNTSGLASLDAKARFVLLPETYPNAAQANLNTIASIAQEQVEGTSYLLAKVSGKIPHGGGNIYAEGSPEYIQLQNFITQLASQEASAQPILPSSCEQIAPTTDPRLDAVLTLDAKATFRKAAINLAGRVPTAAENSRLAQFPEKLDESLEALLEEEAFYERLKEIFNDAFILSKRAQAGFSKFYFQTVSSLVTDYPNYEEFGSTTQARELYISLWEEPLALIAYIARHNRPFTEILTANYTVVNPYTAYLYGLGPRPLVDAPINDWKPATELRQRRGMTTEALVPKAGVLSSPAFLSRWTTTSTNRSRGRAEFLSKNFLATSILTFALRPVNSSQLDSKDKPTVNNPACAACHYYMDPLAATFTGFSQGAYASYQPHLSTWNNQDFLAGFQGEVFEFPVKDPTKAMPWMAQRIAADVRFPYAMVLRVFEGVTGRKPLDYPRDTKNPNYDLHLSAWESQNAFLHQVASHMAQEGMNIKVAIQDILLSPYFRAAQDPNLPADLAMGLGEGRLLTPDMLARKIRATLGAHWGRFRVAIPKDYDFLTENYNTLYGGLHPTESPIRLTEMNTMMSTVVRAMAQEMGCRIPAWEFTKLPQERTVLTKVQRDTQPLRQNSPSGPLEVDREGENTIRENLAYLHERLLGETVSPNSPEVDISYALFVDVWRERQKDNLTGIKYTSCRGVWALNKANEAGTDFAVLPVDDQITTDGFFTLYAWEAVLTYMLMDFRFIHE